MTERSTDAMLDTATVTNGRSANPSSYVLVVHLRGTVEQFPLPAGREVVVGRAPPAEIVVQDRSVSRLHGRISVVDGLVHVSDLGSRNGTWVGQQRVEDARVAPGQEVLFGDVIVVVRPSMAPAVRAVGFDSHDAFAMLVEHEMRCARTFSRRGAVVFFRMSRDREDVMRRLSRSLVDLLRPVDRVAVHSAEGIEMLLPDASIAEATDVCKKIRALEGDSKAIQLGIASLSGARGRAEDLILAARSAAREACPEKPAAVFEEVAVMTWASKEPRPPVFVPSPGLSAVLSLAKRFASSARTALILGETGTGKELIARFIHANSARATRPMVAVSCATLPADLLESTLFGHKKGAFTGATENKPGVFEAADKGTLFLDEVGELSLNAQKALLRVLQEGTLTRVGGLEEIRVDVRVIAATNQDLKAKCAQGTFREELLFRLNILPVEIPPLRERRSDILPLARAFLDEASRIERRTFSELDPAVIDALESFAWPGNVRELKNVVDRAVILAEGDRIRLEDLPEQVRGAQRMAAPTGSRDRQPSSPPSSAEVGASLEDQRERFEADLIRRTLEECGGTAAEAARRLSVPLRTLQRRIKDLGIRPRR